MWMDEKTYNEGKEGREKKKGEIIDTHFLTKQKKQRKINFWHHVLTKQTKKINCTCFLTKERGYSQK
jgi:hypothetical protein